MTESGRRGRRRPPRSCARLLVAGPVAGVDRRGRAGAGRPAPSRRRRPCSRFLGIDRLAGVDRLRRRTRRQFQLHTLLTEQRHPKTWTLEREDPRRTPRPACACSRRSTTTSRPSLGRAGRRSRRPSTSWPPRSVEALAERRKIYVYGCGATGRLAKQMESAFWRPFWRRVKADAEDLGQGSRAGSTRPSRRRSIGEMTGGRPGPDQLARGLRGPPAHRPPPAPGPRHPQGRRRHLRHRGRRDVLGHRRPSWRALDAVEGRPGLRPRSEPQAPLLRLQQPRRPAAAVRAEPQGPRGAGHHQDQPDDRAAGHHRLDPDAGHDDRDVRRRPRSWRRPSSASCGRSCPRRRWNGSASAGDDRRRPGCGRSPPVLAELSRQASRPSPG